ncbi:unnamed protein product, partial [Allacma fusca]
CPSESQM